MAVDSKIKISLELEKAQAQAQLADFEEKAAAQFKRLQAVQARYAANPTPFVRNQLGASTMAYNRRIDAIQGAQANIEKLQLKIDKEEARKGGKLFGVAVNRQTEAFAKQFLGAYLGRELMNIGFSAAYQVGGNNAGLRKAQEATEGAATGLQIGAAFGPMGAAIGAVTGGLIGLATASIKLQKEIQREQLERSNEKYRSDRDVGRSIQNKMFDRLVDQNTRGGQIKMLTERYDELMGRRGDNNVKNIDNQIKAKGDEIAVAERSGGDVEKLKDELESLEERRAEEVVKAEKRNRTDKEIDAAEKERAKAEKEGRSTSDIDKKLEKLYTRRHNERSGSDVSVRGMEMELKYHEKVLGDIESNQYKILKENYSRSLSEAGSLSGRITDASMQTTLGFQTMGSYNDSLAKQGIYVGGEASSDFKGSLDVAEINKSTLDEVRNIRKIAERLALQGNQNLSGEKGLEYVRENATPRFGI